MAKIRAYKLAEELGIERAEIVEKAAAVGVELKSPMSSLDDDEADQLREKLGKPPAKKGKVVERRVEGRGGATIIRRKRKAEPEPPPPPPEPEPEPVAEDAPAAPAPEPVPEPLAASDPIAEAEATAEGTPGPTAKEEPRTAPTGPAADAERPAAERPAADSPRAAKPKKQFREVVNLREQEQLARQATGRATARRPAQMDPRAFQSPRRKRRDAAQKPPPAAAAASKAKRVVRVEGEISVAELAKQLGAKAAEVQGKLMGLGTMVSLNQTIDSETAEKIAESYGFETQDTGFKEEEALTGLQQPVDEAALEPRPPVITVMGHVDHGKTSLLDAIRKTDVVGGEAGGITQHIGAYQVTVGDAKLTFIDTPGHAAFTEMRARGAQATDIVILVVAASEGVMPQTQEAISHAKAAGVPIVVAINKCDLPGADPQRTRQSLLEHDLVPEEFGGDVISVEVSATKGTGLEKLLEMLALQSEVLELKADPTKPASGVVLEAELDKGRGPVATILVKEGTLRAGDALVVGTSYGRIRAMQDENGQRVKEAPPSTPVQVIGLSSVPDAGDVFHVAENERAAKDVAEHREGQQRGQAAASPRPRRSLEDLFAQGGEGGVKELAVVLKTDVQGTLEAVRDALLKLATDEVKVEVVHAGVGAVSENDVNLAETTGSIIVAFNVRPDPAGRKAAEASGIDLRTYRVIYELTDEVKRAMAGLLPPRREEKFLGRAEVRETFTVPKVGTIAGCYVPEGKIERNAQCRLVRDGVVVHEGKLASLRRFKDDVREVQTGFECGIGIDGYNDVKIGDVIEAFKIEERAATLD
ncbi:MAG TPA: translation initiation factor IF-2 [Myxococcota bacterium]|nr:translation initiation factor IF-2 [Myxococcota bacterium]